MAVISKISSLFIAAFLSASGVQAQTTLTYADCVTPSGSLVEEGSKITTYQLLCGDGDGTLYVSPDGATFEKLCSLLGTGDVETSDDATRNFKDYLSTITDKGFTLFAPTDAAFDAIGLDVVGALLENEDDVPSQILNDLLARWLELHVLPASFLTSDFTCNGNILTLNPSGLNRAQQVQRTRCAGNAATFNQIGGGNVGDADQPTVGSPAGVFDVEDFVDSSITRVVTSDGSGGVRASSDLITCNGVVHIVDIPLRPGRQIDYYGGKGGKGYNGYNGFYYGTKKAKYGYTLPAQTSGSSLVSFFGDGRMLEEGKTSDKPKAETDRNADRENRRARLESLLVDANGNIESVN